MYNSFLSDLEQWFTDDIINYLSKVEERIQEWRDDGVYSGDRGFQDMLEEADTLTEELERRENER